VSQSVKGVRDLRKLIPRSLITFNVDPSLTTTTNGWEILGDATHQFAVYRTYIDIVGWSKDDVTAFTQGAAFQEAASIVCIPGLTTLPLKCWDMVTVNHIADTAFTDADLIVQGVTWSPPGTSTSNYNLEEVLAGQWREYMSDSTLLATTRLIGSGSWGAGDATAGDRIHITKAFYLGSSLDTGAMIIIPEGAVVVPTLLVKESDLVYMERLRRSYVLAENR